ncbi:MAG: DUF362 domain-containing protein [Desulfobacula sp.]|uniref:DUF362 domain-containing protein n=1 Tax=Desulfobacula sp. TaxID=2593537 RepID=UPI0025C2D650|nr:DUF362 domain-containing protein [Desulfobacula sp.]MCD4718509.1 DUF362 domain-containing protein [Desulfobacula sp.]
MHNVGLVKYTKPYDSLKKAIDIAGGIEEISGNSKVFIKPNFVVWFDGVPFPKYGVLTTARMIEDLVIFFNEHGISDLTLVEGAANINNKSKSIIAQATKGMGLDKLSKRYGLKVIDVHESSFTDVDLDDVTLSVNSDILNADHIINMAVLKTHTQCKVSLGIKNLKGLINIESRKKCHNPDMEKNLDFHVSKLAKMLSPGLNIIDGIYSLEYGPSIYGQAIRSNLIIASKDMISNDKIGATLLGYSPEKISHIALAAASQNRSIDLTDVNVQGDISLKKAIKPHKYLREQSQTDDMPQIFEAFGIKGICLPEVDSTLCTYCVPFFAYATAGIVMSQNENKTFDDIEILSGKKLKPSGTHKHTLLLGQCQVKLNRKNPKINDCVMIKGCPPKKEDFINAFSKLGIELPENPIEWMNNLPSFFMGQYMDKPEFEESFYKI